MKGKSSQGLLPKKWPGTGDTYWGPDHGDLKSCLLLFLGGFLLCGARLGELPLPVAACLALAVPTGLGTAAAALGAVLGYILFSKGAACIGLLALVGLMLAASVVFQGSGLGTKAWFFPALCTGVCALLKGIELLTLGGSFWYWLFYCVSGGVFCGVFRRAVASDGRARLLAEATLLWALGQLPLPVNLGLLCAIALCVSGGGLGEALMFGLALDLGGGGVCTAALILPAFVCGAHGRRDHRALLFLLLPNLVFLLLARATVGNALAIAAGAGLGLIFSELGIVRLQTSPRSEADTEDSLRRAAEVMEILRRQLPDKPVPPCVGEAESVFNGAAERVCRCCEYFHRCWQHRARETYDALSAAARPMIQRGLARREDLPEEFRERCRHLDGFLTALNQELEGMIFRRRYRMQLEESRQVLAEELECMAEFFRVAQAERLVSNGKKAAWLPRVGVCTVGKNGSRISGDRGACFFGRNGDYFVILCDGMGTGLGAQRSGGETVALLENLLHSGLKPESALKMLNGVELLRGDDRYTTVDLLHLNLTRGEAGLYKWGSAPSYWRKGEEVKKIGTAAPPPGVGVGGEHAPERYELSLKEGELLILTSDGAGGEETERLIACYQGNSPQELAALLISAQPPEDDMSAVVVSLRPYVL